MTTQGQNIAITPFRKLVIDLLHFSQKVPAVAVDRRMNLAPLVAARRRCAVRPTWTSIFLKGYAIVAAGQPLLRRSYMSFPWPRFYEHPKNIVNVNVSRRVGDEDIVVQALIRSPETQSLTDLDAILRRHQELPVEAIRSYQRARSFSRLPFVLRRLLMWGAINWIGRRRCHNFGTFGITSVADRGAGVLSLIPLVTSILHYGLFDERGCLDVRCTIDHRVLDGGPVADALVQLEQTLLGEILAEVETMGKPQQDHATQRRAA